MKYTKIKIADVKSSNPLFYRIILIRDDIDLFKLGAFFGYCIDIDFKKGFSIISNEIEYISKNSNKKDKLDNFKYLCDYNISDLDDSFNYEYGDDFFNICYCKKYKRKVNYNSSKEFIILEGLGRLTSFDKMRDIFTPKDNELVHCSKSELDACQDYELFKFTTTNEFLTMFDYIDVDKINLNLNEDFNNIYQRLLLLENVSLFISNKC